MIFKFYNNGHKKIELEDLINRVKRKLNLECIDYNLNSSELLFLRASIALRIEMFVGVNTSISMQKLQERSQMIMFKKVNFINNKIQSVFLSSVHRNS